MPDAFTVAPDGTSVIDPDQVTVEVEQVLDAATEDLRLGTRITGVAMDTFAASLIEVDAAGGAQRVLDLLILPHSRRTDADLAKYCRVKNAASSDGCCTSRRPTELDL